MAKILTVFAKCSDMCWVGYTNEKFEKFEHDGYVPEGIGISTYSEDYVGFDVDIETGKILNWNVTEKDVLKVLKKK